jgi:sugar phosphate isomerase/epimerase
MKSNLNRRRFIKNGVMITAGMTLLHDPLRAVVRGPADHPIRLGGPIPGKFNDPAEWVRAVKKLGYSAAYCPVQPGTPEELISAYRTEAGRNNIIIAEVGVWNNMLHDDEKLRKENLKKNMEALHLADQIGAGCCVNISGARGEVWDGPYSGNYTKDTFDLIVETVRSIIDQVRPVKASYTLEPMPYMLPDSPDTYLDLIRAIDRKQFAAHLDPVNMISSPQRYFNNAAFLKECFQKLGPYLKSIHAKDIIILPKLTVHLEERRPGLGALDYQVFLKEATRFKDIPFMMEHLETQDEYLQAARYIRDVGTKQGIKFVE